MGYGCFLPRAGYAAFFEHKIQEKHIPGGIFCSGSLTTASPKPAATNESALAAPSASKTIRAPANFQDNVRKTERTPGL
jgi:hypothetical protein